jgi:ABC-2 type transport system permease protein
VVALLAVTTVSHDYRYRLVRAVLIAQPRRGVMIAARLVVLSVTGAGVAALTSVLAAAGCLAAGRRPLLDMTTLRVLLFHAGVVVGWAWLAAGLTWLLRHAAGVVTILLTGPLAVEPVLLIASRSDQAAFLRPLTGWLPFSAARQALGRNLTADALPGAVPDGAGRAALIFTVVVLAVAGTASLAVCRRDA